jgi:hypothetical protein
LQKKIEEEKPKLDYYEDLPPSISLAKQKISETLTEIVILKNL